VHGQYAYVADFTAGLQVVDIGNPTAPVRVGNITVPQHAAGVDANDQYAYVAAASAGLRIIDITVPSTPHEVGFYATTSANDVFVSGDVAYVADAGAGLRAIDVSNPGSPFEIGSYDTPGNAKRVVVDGNLAYVADDYAGLRVIDLTTFSESGYFNLPASALDVAVAGGNIYVASMYAGMVVLRLTTSTAVDGVPIADTGALGAPPVLRAYPNPMAAGGTTRVALSVAEAMSASLTVFDVSGRRIRALEPLRFYAPGQHEVIWDGRDDGGRRVASGAYFMRLEAGRRSWQHRLILLR
jgi:hypothetical protein